MNYLINEIVDKFEINSRKLGEWYDFLWNRTRAIRKDITIQQLTGSNIIEIIEKCARFHILCSYKLCEQQSNVFDFKINEENLANCMQLLKELYKDEEDSNQMNSNKSEFLSYSILLNLDKEGLIQEISSIANRIKQSSHLQFAIKIYLAYKTRNYCAFIRLLINSTLLQSCILNRYLNRVRLSAFYLIGKAIIVGQQNVLIPQDYFMKQLAFKENELSKFCKLINCDLEDRRIVLSKKNELNLDFNFKLSRNALIDKKFGKLKLSQIVVGIERNKNVSVQQLLFMFEKVDFFNNPN